MSAKSCELRTVMMVNISSQSNEVAISVRDLVVDYKQVRAVNKISFDAKAGEVTVVIGPNGAGKTSTIEVCSGVRTATSGDVSVLGIDPQKNRTHLNKQIGVMLQDGGIAPTARVGSLIRHYCALYDRGVDAMALIDRLGLASRAKATWRSLSGGERQRFSLALALAADPEMVFLDEPTAGVDLDGRDIIREIIGDLVGKGACVVLATHDLDEAQRVAHHAVVLHLGRVVINERVAVLCANGRRLEDVVREATR